MSMKQQEEAMEKKTVRMSRREFLRDTGLVVGGATIGSMALIGACQGATKTVTQSQVSTVTMPGAIMTAVISGSTSVKTVTVTNQPVVYAPDTVAPVVQTVVPGASNITITAEKMTFDDRLITVLAGLPVSIVFNNKDAGVTHNISVYTDSTATTPIFIGPSVTGPGTVVYSFTAPSNEDTYFFRCDTHPKTMTGYFVVWAPC
jgi:hypothetical protein